ncbi:uncharacterized protein LOC144593962 isoform X2 [Rhinoraja longicauda]
MGGGGSKWRKAAVGPPLPAASQRESVCSEEGAGGEGLQRWEGDWPPVVQRQAGRAAAASGDWTLQAGGGSSRRPQPSPWRLPKAPCGDCTPSIQCLSGGQDGGSNSNRSPDNPRPPRAAGAGACAWPSTLSGCSLGLGNSRRSPGSAHIPDEWQEYAIQLDSNSVRLFRRGTNGEH